jgi:hypothetical protein
MQVELWRLDLCAAVLELDGDGFVLVPEVVEVAQLYPGDLLLGLPAESIVDQHIGIVLPAMTNRSLFDLFTPGAVGPMLAEPGTARRGGGKRSTMKPPPRESQPCWMELGCILWPHRQRTAGPSVKTTLIKRCILLTQCVISGSLSCACFTGPPQFSVASPVHALTVAKAVDRAVQYVSVQVKGIYKALRTSAVRHALRIGKAIACLLPQLLDRRRFKGRGFQVEACT